MSDEWPEVVAELVNALRVEGPEVQLVDDVWTVSVSAGFRRWLDIEADWVAGDKPGVGGQVWGFEVFERSVDETNAMLDDIRLGSAPTPIQAAGLVRARLNTLVTLDSEGRH